jgi:hypothetical protein
MPGFLTQEVNKRLVDLDAIIDRTQAKIDKTLTRQQDHSGVYLSVGRPKHNQQTTIITNKPTNLHQSHLSFALPARVIVGHRGSLSLRARARRTIHVVYAGKSGKARGIVYRDEAHQLAIGDVPFYQLIKENDLEVTTFTAWRAPADAAPVLYSLIETIFMVAFGTLLAARTTSSDGRGRIELGQSMAVNRDRCPWIVQMDLDFWNWAGRVSRWIWTEVCSAQIRPSPLLTIRERAKGDHDHGFDERKGAASVGKL